MKRHIIRCTFAGMTAAAAMVAALPMMNLSAAQTLAGDVDKNGAVEVADAILLQKYLVGLSTLDQTAAENADVYADGAVNIFDLAKLKSMLVSPVSNTVYIHLKGTSITTEGDDNNVVQISGTTAKITASGVYYVDGDITDGQLYVETAAADIDDVEIVLSGTSFTNSTKQAIYTSAASGNDKTKITLTGANTITDTASAAYTDGAATIYTNNKLTVTKASTGSLTVSSLFNDGIHSEKKLNLNGGTINIDTDTVPEGSTAVPDADGITSDKNIEIEGAVLDIDASGDGIKTDAGVYVFDGDVQIKAGNDAVQAAAEIAVSGGNVVASGDRGFRLTGDAATGTVGKLNITGGTVMATATDYQVNGNETIDTSGSTQAIMLLDMAAEWKKASTITVNSTEFASNKKYDYVLVSDASITASQNCKVYIGGAQAKHEGDATGSFQNSGVVTQYKAVDLLTGGETVVSSDNVVSSIVYNNSGVALYDANGAALDASSVSNVSVTNGTYVTITKSGDYTISGTSTNGQIKVSTDDTAEPLAVVTMSFDGLTLSNSTAAPVYIENVGDEAVISAKNGTTSTISDGTSHSDTYTNSEGTVKTIGAAIFARDDLKIKGKGTLVVNGNTEDGIVCTNDLKIWNGDVQVTAQDDVLRGNDSVKIGDADDMPVDGGFDNLKVTLKSTGGDGIKSDSDTKGDGNIIINGGTVSIDAYCDGIQGSTAVQINGGSIDIKTFEGSNSTSFSNESQPGQGGQGGRGGWNPWDQGSTTTTTDSQASAKGIKCNSIDADTTARSAVATGDYGTITIAGGTITIDSSDDAIHSSGYLNITGGNLTIATGDDGIHSDGTVNIGNKGGGLNDVTINITKSYEGVEGYNINHMSGTCAVVSSDDGYNASAGSEMTSSTAILLNISGGAIYVKASGDGVDSNGILNISGGYTFVSQTGGGNAPLDRGDASGCGVVFTGGVVIAAGSTDMMSEGINGSQTCASSSANVSAGGTIVVANSSGTVLGGMKLANAGQGVTVYSAGGSSSDKVYANPTVSGSTNVITGTGDSNMVGFTGGTVSGGTQIANNYSGGGRW